jgi:iron complex transport system substrate-binding protein
MKNKTLGVVEIVIVLCSVLLVALPAIVADQTMQEVSTTASEDDYTLGIYGNANEDDTIDMRDVTYIKLVIFGQKPETELADAYYDDEVDVLDVVQTKLIILGRESELTIIDSAGRSVTIPKPVERVVIAYFMDAAMTLQALGAEDTVVGVTDAMVRNPLLFPELSELPSVGIGPSPDCLDYERILELQPDVVFTGGTSGDPTSYEVVSETIHSLDPDIKVLFITFCSPSHYIEEVRKTGYMFDRKREAEELIDFIEEHLNEIKEKVSDIPRDERTKVYTEFFADYLTGGEGTVYHGYVEMAGGINVFGDLPSYGEYYHIVTVDPEAVIERNPEVILFHGGAAFGPEKIGYQTDDITALRDKRDEIMDRSGFANVPAVKNGRVYTCSSDIVLCAVYFVGVAYYAEWFYPELFDEDWDPNAIHQEYLDRFLRIDYDLDEHGVFVYHPGEHPDGR